MNVKKSLGERIRGWLPKEPYLPRTLNSPNSQNKKPARITLSKASLGVKLVVALFWIFGFGTILALIQQATQLGYVPFNLQFLMASVTAADGVALFVIGAGLLTMRKRWMDIAMIFSVVSLVVFYVVPLRFALPLEVIALAYLVTLRSGRVSKLIQVAPVALLVIFCVASFTPVLAVDAQLINPSKTLVLTHSQTSEKGDFNVTVNLYQYTDLDKEKDYYVLEINLQCQQKNFNHAIINASIGNAMVMPPWTPQSNPSTPVAIAFGIATLYIGNPKTVTSNYDANKSGNIIWAESSLNPEKSELFSTDLWASQAAHLAANINAQAGFDDKVFGRLWTDNLTIGGLEW